MNTSQVWGVGLVAKLNFDVNGKNLNLNPLHTSKSGGGGWGGGGWYVSVAPVLRRGSQEDP